jgi:hypothetical protein
MDKILWKPKLRLYYIVAGHKNVGACQVGIHFANKYSHNRVDQPRLKRLVHNIINGIRMRRVLNEN